MSLEPFGDVNGLLADFLVFLKKEGLIQQGLSSREIVDKYWEGFQ